MARATAGLWDLVQDRPGGLHLPGPELMAVGPRLGEAAWLLCGLRDDCRPLYEGLHARLHSAPSTLRDALPAPGPAATALPAPGRRPRARSRRPRSTSAPTPPAS
ncbi:hypothetical protein GCM10020220_084080 [Nonomuraea rubra]